MRPKAIRTRPGLPYPLGASWDGAGVNFALFTITDKRLVERGLTNYWGYDSIGFFAPDRRFSSVGDQYPLAGRSLALLRLRRPSKP